MGEITKFPFQETCVDCGKPLEDDEGKVCPVEGCGSRGCWFCTQQSETCARHLGIETDD